MFFGSPNFFGHPNFFFECPKVKLRWSKIIWKAQKKLFGADGMGTSQSWRDWVASDNGNLKYLTLRFIPHMVGFEHNQKHTKWGIGSSPPFHDSPFCSS